MSFALETNVCSGLGQASCQNSKDNVGELLQTWSALSATLASNDETLIGIAIEICSILTRRNSYDALEVFLGRLPNTTDYTNSQSILRSKIALALKRKQAKVVQDIIKNHTFENAEELIKAWDEAHYMEEEERLQKPLTPLARFRVRKRNPPPKTICPSGVRKMASLPKGATRILKQWLVEHYNDPYPNGDEKIALAKFSGLTSNQVKTWFANARRRIHKGENLQSGKKGLNAFDARDNNNIKNHFMIRNDFDDSYDDVSLQSDPNSFFAPYFSTRVDHTGAGNGYDRMYSFRCVHSMYNPHSCFHCKDVIADGNNCVAEYATSDARCFQHNMNAATALPVHPTPTYSFPRWSHRSPFQCRQDDFDSWYRSISYQTEMHAHVPSFDANIHGERPSVVENGGQSFIDPCLQNNTGLHEKAEAMHIDASKDSLTEVGAARILADLSSKQNFSTQFDQAHTILTAANI